MGGFLIWVDSVKSGGPNGAAHVPPLREVENGPTRIAGVGHHAQILLGFTPTKVFSQLNKASAADKKK